MGVPSFTPLAPSNVSAAVKLRPVPAREFQANSSIRKQAAPGTKFWRKEKVGVLVGFDRFFYKKNTYKHQTNTCLFFFSMFVFFLLKWCIKCQYIAMTCTIDCSNRFASNQEYWRLFSELPTLTPVESKHWIHHPHPRLETGETWWYRSLLPGISVKKHTSAWLNLVSNFWEHFLLSKKKSIDIWHDENF